MLISFNPCSMQPYQNRQCYAEVGSRLLRGMKENNFPCPLAYSLTVSGYPWTCTSSLTGANLKG